MKNYKEIDGIEYQIFTEKKIEGDIKGNYLYFKNEVEITGSND